MASHGKACGWPSRARHAQFVCVLLTVFDTASALKLENSFQTSIYVYELPQRKGSAVWRDSELKCEEISASPVSPKMQDCLFGKPSLLNLGSGPDSAFEIRDAHPSALATQAYAALKSHPRRTHDPSQASVFYIPLDRNVYPIPGLLRPPCPSPEQMIADLPYLTSENAHLHFMIHSHPGSSTSEYCPSFRTQPTDASPAAKLLAKVKKFALEDRRSWSPLALKKPMPQNLVSWPYPAITSGLPRDTFNRLQRELHAPGHQRHTLVLAMLGLHGDGQSMRRNLSDQCSKRPQHCKYVNIMGNHSVAKASMLRAGATFCLEPPGDSASRKGVVDDIVLGCIPVLFTPSQATLWPAQVNRWSDLAVTNVDFRSDVISMLAAIPQSEIVKKRMMLAAAAPKFTWSKIGEEWPHDGLSTMLAAVARNE